jgi:alpha-glucosidase
MSYQFVNVDAFVPNSVQGWSGVGDIVSVEPDGNVFLLRAASGMAVQLSFLGPQAFRVRFHPVDDPDYSRDPSYAVVDRDLGAVTVQVASQSSSQLVLDTGSLRVEVGLQPYALSVYRGAQLIHQEPPERNLIYAQGGPAVANFKTVPDNALYFGFGEKAGSQLAKNGFAMTFFNFDNFTYASGPLPSYEDGGPLNPTEALYNSTPLLIEVNPSPSGAFAGPAYSYGLFFDNPSQSYINIEANIPTQYPSTPMDGLYYFGALYGEIDYYFLAGENPRQVVDQYTRLTGRPPLPPKYALGYHQGCYGYYDRDKLTAAAQAYRDNAIPIDGLHIDVDFQNNYRTFTSSDEKFPDPAGMFADLHAIGFKCSTNITSLITTNPYDEKGSTETPYPARDSGVAGGFFIYDTDAGAGEDPELFQGFESYGTNDATNPFPYPPLASQNGSTPLGAVGYYPNLGDPAAQAWWGEQYAYLLSIGLDMIWQDMTCPATASDVTPSPGTSPSYEQQVNQGLNDPGDDADKTFPLDLMIETPGGVYVPSAQVHNAFSLLLCQATWNGLSKLRPEQRNFIIARGGYAGLQRYAALWTGDSASSWDFLSINIPEVLNLGLSGQPISGCDIGGFASGSGSSPSSYVPNPAQPGTNLVEGGITDPELLVRWMNLGAFLPWYRNHYDGYSKQYQEPYAYGDPYLSYCRKYIELRYRMLQIFYDAMYQATQTGLPIARAMFLNFPNDPQVYQNLNDQFFVGDSVLVAPIVQQGSDTRNIYLPQGAGWYAFQDESSPLLPVVAGGTLIGVTEGTTPYYAPLGEVPIYIAAGAILPMRQVEQWVGQLAQNPLTFQIYPGPDSAYTLYLDDGVSTQAQTQGAYRLTEVRHTAVSGGQSVRVQRIYDHYTPPEPYYVLAFLGTPAPPQSVTAAGTSLTEVTSGSALASSTVDAWFYDSPVQIVYVKVFDVDPDVTVVVTFA